MKRLTTYLLLLSVFALAAAALNAQTRQRRVGQKPPPVAPNASGPSRAPVLGGAIRTPGTQTLSIEEVNQILEASREERMTRGPARRRHRRYR